MQPLIAHQEKSPLQKAAAKRFDDAFLNSYNDKLVNEAKEKVGQVNVSYF